LGILGGKREKVGRECKIDPGNNRKDRATEEVCPMEGKGKEILSGLVKNEKG